MDRLQHMVIDLTVWGSINLWWAERWFIYGIEESPGLLESDCATADLLLFPHSSFPTAVHNQACTSPASNAISIPKDVTLSYSLDENWWCVWCTEKKSQAPCQNSAAAACLYRTHMQKVTPQGFCTIRYKTTVPWTVVIIEVQDKRPLVLHALSVLRLTQPHCSSTAPEQSVLPPQPPEYTEN